MGTDFAQVKNQINLLGFITSETGFKIKGKHLEQCPFCGGHECFTVNPDQTYKCFQCGDDRSFGDVFHFIEKKHGLSKSGALKYAAEFAGITLSLPSKQKSELTINQKILNDSAEYYHRALFNGPGLQHMTVERGHVIESLKRMKVGFSDGHLLGFLRSRGYSFEDIVQSGMVVEKEKDGQTVRYDFFGHGLITFPSFGKGNVLHFTCKDPQKKKPSFQLNSEKRSKDWIFYNQDAFGFQKDVILVEGQNDLLSCMDAGHVNVIGMIGQISKEQIQALSDRCKEKVLYIWADNDAPKGPKAKRAGDETVRKICSALKDRDIKIFVYPGELDPDDYLKGFQGNKAQEIERLKAEAVDYISWEILQAGKKESLEEKIESLREYKIFELITLQVGINRQIYVDKLERLGLDREGIERELDETIDVRRKIDLYVEGFSNKRDADPNIIAGIIHDYFSKEGRFFYDRHDRVYLLFYSKTFDVGNNRPFNALIKKMTRLLPTKEPGRSVWESLASEAYNTGQMIDLASWIKTDREKDCIFFNLNSPKNIIIKVTKDGVEEVPNGLNEDTVLLKSSNNIQPFTYLPDADVKEGFHLLKTLFFDTLSCEKRQKYLIFCWAVSGFLVGFFKNRAIMKFAGGAGSGKTTAAKFISLLFFGTEDVGTPSSAAAFAEASQNPIIFIDNLESDDINNSMRQFLLLSATGGNKTKRTSGTESDTTKERPDSLVLVTAIEPFLLPELISRTIEIDFKNEYKKDDFLEDEITRALIKNRNLILSSLLKFIAKRIIPKLEERRDYINILKKEYRGHAKDRMDEHFAMMMLILERCMPFIPLYENALPDHQDVVEIRKTWIEYQNIKASDNESSSNTILQLLEGLVREYVLRINFIKPESNYIEDICDYGWEYTHPDIGIPMIISKPRLVVDEKTGNDYRMSKVVFISSAKEIVLAFSSLSKITGVQNTKYTTPSVFGSRLGNDLNILKKERWELVTKPGLEPYFKVIRGKRSYKFQHDYIY